MDSYTVFTGKSNYVSLCHTYFLQVMLRLTEINVFPRNYTIIGKYIARSITKVLL